MIYGLVDFGGRRSTCKQENNRGQGHFEGRHANRGGSARQRAGADPGRRRDVLARLRADAAAREGARVAVHRVSLRSARPWRQRRRLPATTCSARSRISMPCCSTPADPRWCSASRPAPRSPAKPCGSCAAFAGSRSIEAPYVIDNTHEPLPPNFIAETRALVASGNRSAAVKKFMRYVGTPAIARVRDVAAAVLEEAHGDRAHARRTISKSSRRITRAGRSPRASGRW